jgi:1,4-dihydroxy-2-naphthoate octaprenyltransferase
MNSIKTLLGTTRPPFLLLTPACTAVGVGSAHWTSNTLDWANVFLVFIGALCAHISVNVFNEYFDFKSGLDKNTKRTPFSGGSGSLQAMPEAKNKAIALALITLFAAALVGCYFLQIHGIGLLPIGLAGLILVVTYTIWWVNNPILCLIAPGLGFGLLMVNGTHFALSGSYDLPALIASLVPSFLVSNLLLLNQFPDVDADRHIGRRHFPITAGLEASTRLYGIFLLMAYSSLAIGVALNILPVLCLIALLPAPLAYKSYRGVRQNTHNIPLLLPSMGLNVAVNLLTPFLLALGLFLD